MPVIREHRYTLSTTGRILCDGLEARVILTRNHIYIGCSRVEIEVLKTLLASHEMMFPKMDEQVILQDGSHPC